MRLQRLLLSMVFAVAVAPSAMAGNGGSISSIPEGVELARYPGLHDPHGGYGWSERRARHGSMSRGNDYGWPGSEGAPYGTSGTGGGSVAVIQINRALSDRELTPSFHTLPGAHGPKIIDVETARLDRRPYGPDGLDIVQVGTTKIIRISPDFRRASASEKDDVHLGRAPGSVEFAKLSPAEQAVTVYPDPDVPVDKPERPRAVMPGAARIPVPSPAPEEARVAQRQAEPAVAPQPPAKTPNGFEPWTDEWLRDCVSRYPNFDASLGTYTDESGRRRFCTGDAAN